MADIIIRAVISKEKGRELIKSTPIDLFQKMAENSRRKGECSKYYNYIPYSLKYSVVTNTQLAILSLFNDDCYFCGKPFTHYIIGKPAYGIKYCCLYPCRFDENGEIVYYNIDHIYPKSMGGADRLENYRLTCENLNCARGTKLSDEDKKYGVKKVSKKAWHL
mgnify:FL=1